MTDEAGIAVAAATETETAAADTGTAQDQEQNLEPVDGKQEGADGEQGESQQVEEKTFTQAEFDKKLKTRLSREQRKAERRLAEMQGKIDALASMGQQPASAESSEQQDQGTYDDFKTRYEAEQARVYFEKQSDALLDKVSELNPDFDFEEFGTGVPVTDDMARALIVSDIGPEMVNHLYENPELAEQIASLPPAKQGLRMGKLEIELEQKKAKPSEPQKKTGAPVPAKTTKGTASTKPRYYDGISPEEYFKKRAEDLKRR